MINLNMRYMTHYVATSLMGIMSFFTGFYSTALYSYVMFIIIALQTK